MPTCGHCDGHMTYRYGPGAQVTEIAPTHCRHGHEFGPWKVTIGYDHGEPPHRTYYCQACEAENRSDPWTLLELEADKREYPR